MKTVSTVVSIATRMLAWYDALLALLADGVARWVAPSRLDLEWKIKFSARAS